MIPNAQHFQSFGVDRPVIDAGFGRADMTPPLGTLCALGVDDEALEIFDPVYARATVLGRGDQAVAILSLDVIGLYRPETQDLRSFVAERTGLKPERIIVHGTHTHESPGTHRCFTQITEKLGLAWHSPEFYDLMRSQAARAVQFALAESHPTAVSCGFWPVAGLASNRRLNPLDGPTVLRQSRSTPDYREYPEGWIDPYARMLVFSDVTSGREHWLVNYACHPTAAGGDEGPYITADFPGNAMARIQATRPRVTCNYLTGCCGNVNAGKYTTSGNEPDPRAADVVRLGGRLAEALEAAHDRNLQPLAGGGLRYTHRSVALPLLPRVLERAALERQLDCEARQYLEGRAAGQRVRGGGATLFWTLYNLFAAREAGGGSTLSTEVSALSIGDACVLFLPGECFLEIAAAIRAHFPERKLLIAALCDYGPGYIVTPEAFGGGGYESEAALCDPSALQQLIDEGIAAIDEVCQTRRPGG